MVFERGGGLRAGREPTEGGVYLGARVFALHFSQLRVGSGPPHFSQPTAGAVPELTATPYREMYYTDMMLVSMKQIFTLYTMRTRLYS